MDSFEYIVMKKYTSGLNRIQQQLCNALAAAKEKCDHYKEEANRAIVDAECALVAPYGYASKVSMFIPSYKKRSKRLSARAILYELSENFLTDWFHTSMNSCIQSLDTDKHFQRK